MKFYYYICLCLSVYQSIQYEYLKHNKLKSFKNNKNRKKKFQQKSLYKFLKESKIFDNPLNYNPLGDLELTIEMASDLNQMCVQTNQEPFGQQYIRQVNQQLKAFLTVELVQRHYVYYVKSEGSCYPKDKNLGTLLMLTDHQWPEKIDFHNPYQKLLFLKVCHNGQDHKPHILSNCVFDSCEETSIAQDLQMSVTTFEDNERRYPKKGNCVKEINEDSALWLALNQNHNNKIDLDYSQVMPFGRAYK